MSLSAQRLNYDTGIVKLRDIQSVSIEKFKTSPDFSYITSKEPPQSWWDKFWSWVWWKIDQILSTKTGRITFWSVLGAVALIIIGYFLFMVTGLSKSRLFSRRDTGEVTFVTVDDDINTISFDHALRDALDKNDYRLAVRILYLKQLKTMSDKGVINWQINKTNSDYLREVANNLWSNLFKSITSNFELIWYGEKEISLIEFEKMELLFDQLNKQMK